MKLLAAFALGAGVGSGVLAGPWFWLPALAGAMLGGIWLWWKLEACPVCRHRAMVPGRGWLACLECLHIETGVKK